MDYDYCRDLLEEDSSEEGHPNIDRKTFKKWKQDRKKQIRKDLTDRLEEIKEKEELAEEAAIINALLRDRIVEKETYTSIPIRENKLEVAVIETDSPYLQEIASEICESNSILKYIEVIKKALSSRDTEEIAEEIEEYLLLGIKYNIEEKCYDASLRMAQCAMALEYVKMEPTQITGSAIEGIGREGYLYHKRILEHYQSEENPEKNK